MGEEQLLALLKFDLQRIGGELGDDEYLRGFICAAKANLSRQGIQETVADDYTYLVVGTAAWMYRKRANGEAEPCYLRRMRLDLLLSQKMGGGADAT